MTKVLLGFYAMAMLAIWWTTRGKPDTRMPAVIMACGLSAAVVSLFAVFFVGKGAMIVGALGLVAFAVAYAVSLKSRPALPRASRTPRKGIR